MAKAPRLISSEAVASVHRELATAMAATVPDFVHVVPVSDYVGFFIEAQRRYGRQRPIELEVFDASDPRNEHWTAVTADELEELLKSGEPLPPLHFAIGSGRNHQLRIDSEHSDELLSMIESKYEAAFNLRRSRRLEEMDLTFDDVLVDPQAAAASEKAMTGHARSYLSSSVRNRDPAQQVAWHACRALTRFRAGARDDGRSASGARTP